MIIFKQEGTDIEFVSIENGEGVTTMLKSTYDAMQAEQSTPIVKDETKTK
jgi:hypothetical protein